MFALGTHGSSLVAVRNGQVQFNQGRTPLADFTVDDIILAGGLIIIGNKADLIAQAQAVLL